MTIIVSRKFYENSHYYLLTNSSLNSKMLINCAFRMDFITGAQSIIFLILFCFSNFAIPIHTNPSIDNRGIYKPILSYELALFSFMNMLLLLANVQFSVVNYDGDKFT